MLIADSNSDFLQTGANIAILALRGVLQGPDGHEVDEAAARAAGQHRPTPKKVRAMSRALVLSNEPHLSADYADHNASVISVTGSARVRLLMPLPEAERLAERLASSDTTQELQRLLDQLWLRSVLIEQWRRTRLNERGEFERRADRLLEALDP